MMLCVCGSSLYTINTIYTAVKVASLLTSSGKVYITDNGVGAYITDGSNRYSYIWGTGAFAILTDGGFTGADVCDELDNYIIYNLSYISYSTVKIPIPGFLHGVN